MSNQQPEENRNLLNSIAATVETMRDQMATKEDLERFATKEDLERFATKDDFDSLREQVGYIGGQLETMRDRMATKDDIARLDSKVDKLDGKVDKLEVETTIIRGDVEQVHLRRD